MDLKIGRPADGTTKKFPRDARKGNTNGARAVVLVVDDDGDVDGDTRWAHIMANFLGEMEVAIAFYAKFWTGKHVLFFSKKFFLARQENFHFSKTFSLYL